MDWLFKKVEAEHDLTTGEGKKTAGRLLLPWIRRLPDLIEQTHYLQLLSRKIGVGEEVLRGAISQARLPARSERGDHDRSARSSRDDKARVLEQLAIRLAALWLLAADKASFLTDFSFTWLGDSRFVTLYKNLNSFYDSHTAANAMDWLAQLEGEAESLGREIVFWAEELNTKLSPVDQAREADILKRRLKVRYIQDQLRAVREQIRSAEAAGRNEEVSRYLAEWQHWSKELSGIQS